MRLATTADQIAAREIGKTTQVPSLELNLDLPTQGACDTGDCFYDNTISWRNPTTPNPAETHPRLVFERLFGDGGSAGAAAGADEAKRQHSRFGDCRKSAASSKTLGPGDRTKLTEYLDSVREIEQRIQSRGGAGRARSSSCRSVRPISRDRSTNTSS